MFFFFKFSIKVTKKSTFLRFFYVFFFFFETHQSFLLKTVISYFSNLNRTGSDLSFINVRVISVIFEFHFQKNYLPFFYGQNRNPKITIANNAIFTEKKTFLYKTRQQTDVKTNPNIFFTNQFLKSYLLNVPLGNGHISKL